NSEKDVIKTLEAYLLEGTITLEEKAEIAERILHILKDDKYSDYFAENQLVINEKDIMISENGESKIYRPDRMINTGTGYIIIDFKTGDEREKHQEQIAEYRSVLEKLGKKVLRTEIIYV
ncbi:MAG: DNA helicase UvrD, partial [Chryseobacterium sp.]|nr:DNA helicase UvrD [Chryseobacterium sp.]